MAEKKTKSQNKEKIYRKEICATENTIEKEKKTYRGAVKILLKADKELKAAEKKAKKKKSEKNVARLEAAKKAVAMAALEFKAADDTLDNAVEDLQHKSNYLCRYYHSQGKPKAARKESARFDKYYERYTAELSKVSKNSDNVVSSAFAGMVVSKKDKKNKKPVPQPVPFEKSAEAAPVEEAPAVVASSAACAPAPQVAEQPSAISQTSFAAALDGAAPQFAAPAAATVAPVSIDVTEIVEEAVNATMKNFMSALEKKMAGVSFAVPGVTGAENPEALSTVATEEAYVVKRLGELIDGMKEIMEAINLLSAKSAELVEKQKAASEVQNELTKTQRTTMREIQGIQVRQKLVISEQEALVAEQTVAFEHHKLVAEAQQALSEQQQISVDEINALIDNQKALNATVKETVDSNKSIVALAEKTVEIQKNLSEKQQDLLVAQKEAMTAHRQMARGQRSAEAKRRTAENRAAKKAAEEKKAEEAAAAAAEAPAVEAEVSLEAMATE